MTRHCYATHNTMADNQTLDGPTDAQKLSHMRFMLRREQTAFSFQRAKATDLQERYRTDRLTAALGNYLHDVTNAELLRLAASLAEDIL